MLDYNHILYATDLDSSCEKTIQRVLLFASKFDAKVSLVHVVKNITSSYGFAAVDIQVEKSLVHSAREKMNEFISTLDILEENTIVVTGQVTNAIIDVSIERGCDVIMLNGHTHNIFMRMISTEDSVVNKAHCDVFVLRDEIHT
jgi:universal stress protein A